MNSTDHISKSTSFFILWLLCLIGTACVLPLVEVVANTNFTTKAYLVGFAQAAILYAILVYFGIKFARATQFSIFMPSFKVKSILMDILIGVVLAFFIYFIDLSVFKLDDIIDFPTIPFWKKFIASFYGAFNEEVSMRLFFISLLVKLFDIIFKPKAKRSIFIILAILISAMAFAAGHLPAMKELTELTTLTITRTFVLNGLGGIIFGWLYWRKSLVSAMIAHGTTDIVLAFLP